MRRLGQWLADWLAWVPTGWVIAWCGMTILGAANALFLGLTLITGMTWGGYLVLIVWSIETHFERRRQRHHFLAWRVGQERARGDGHPYHQER